MKKVFKLTELIYKTQIIKINEDISMFSKKWILSLGALAIVAICFSVFTRQTFAEKKKNISSETKLSLEDIDTNCLSRALGHLVVKQLQNPGIQFNIDKIIQGMRDEKAGKPSPMSEEEYEQAIALIQENLFLQVAEKNLSEANAFLQTNQKSDGVICLSPKLQYRVEHVGQGSEVKQDSIPLIHYTGKLMDGTIFASSHENDKPISLPIKQTIPGFSEGLLGMKEGEKRVLYIHPELAYGIAGQLPPNSLLVFEVEVLLADTQLGGQPLKETTSLE